MLEARQRFGQGSVGQSGVKRQIALIEISCCQSAAMLLRIMKWSWIQDFSPRLVASRRVWHMSSIYSHIPLPLCICSESQIPLRGPFLGQRYSFSKAGASSVSLCSGHGCAAGLLRWVRSGWHFSSPCRCFQKGRGTGIPRASLSTRNTDPCQDNDTQVTLYDLAGCKVVLYGFP